MGNFGPAQGSGSGLKIAAGNNIEITQSSGTATIGVTGTVPSATDSSELGGNVPSYFLAWANLTNKPAFAAVATSGKYSDLTGAPTTWSWGSLSGVPSLVNSFQSRSGAITLESGDVTGALGFTPLSTTGTAANSNQLGGVAASSYAQLGAANTFTATQNLSGGFTGYYNIVSATATVPDTAVGGFIEYTGTAASTITLPDPTSTSAKGGMLTVWNYGTGLTLATPAGSFYGVGVSGSTTMTVADGQTLMLMSDGYNWIAIGGSNSFFRTDSGAPNPQTVVNPIVMGGDLTVQSNVPTVGVNTTSGDANFSIKLNGVNKMAIGWHSNNDNRYISVFDGTNWHETDIDASGNWAFVNNIAVAGSITSPNPTFAGSQIFTSSGTFTVPTGVKRVFVQAWGGGGGGGWGNGAIAGGGGGAGYAEGWVQVSNGQQISVTVGIGGAGTSGSNFIGSTGGTSSFGSYVQATGGTGGIGSVGSTGGTGGNGTYGTLLQAGSMGVIGIPYNGGNAATTFGGAGGAGSSTGDGSAGYAPGGGGGGSYGTVGGAGARGEVRVYY